MNSDRQTKQWLIDAVTQRLATPKMTKDQITGTPILVGIAMGLWALIPPHFRTKSYLILAMEVASIVWAGWLYVAWRRRAPTNEDSPTQTQAWTRFNTLIYHLARATWLLPFSLGCLAISLSLFSSLQTKLAQVLLVIGYGITTTTLYANRHWLLEISVTGIQSMVWRRLKARIMSIGLGLVGIGVALGTIISRLASGNVDLWIMGILSSVLALMALAQGFLEFFITKAFIDKDMWRLN